MKNLLSIEDLTLEEISNIFITASFYKANGIERQFSQSLQENLPNTSQKNSQKNLQKKVVFSLFFETSTRTSTSFNLAAKKLGLLTQEIYTNNLASAKGEALTDIIATLNALAPDLFIIRHSESRILEQIKNYISCSIINAGDGTNEHPTQALIDLFTILEVLPQKKLIDKKANNNDNINENTLKNLNITICGDLKNSRVANSGIKLFQKLGANLSFVAPPELMPQQLKNFPHFNNITEALEETDIIMLLRIQKERLQATEASLSYAAAYTKNYNKLYGLDLKKLEKAKNGILIMHPGPVNRGLELTEDIINLPKSLILKQVTNGLYIRAALIRHMLF